MKKNLTVWCNPSLLVSGIILLLVSVGTCSIPFLFPNLMRYKTEADEIGTKWIAAILGIGMIAAVALCIPQWAAKIKFRQDGVFLYVAFIKVTQMSYRDFRYVYYARYYHRAVIPIGYYPKYLVFSKKPLTVYELEHINQVSNSRETIKIRYRKRAFRSLLQILPQDYQNKHKAVFDKFEE